MNSKRTVRLGTVKRNGAIVNKHMDVNSSEASIRSKFESINTEDRLGLGEIVIINDKDKPGIAILDTNGKVRMVGEGYGGGDGTANISAKDNSISIEEKKNPDTGKNEKYISVKISSKADNALKLEKYNSTGLYVKQSNVSETAFNDLTNKVGEMEQQYDALMTSTNEAIVASKKAVQSVKATSTRNDLIGTRTNKNGNDVSIEINPLIKPISDAQYAQVLENGDIQPAVDGLVSATDAKQHFDTVRSFKVNEKLVSENPILESSDLKMGQNYAIIEQSGDISQNDSISEAIARLESMVTSSMLAMSASLNDLEKRIKALETK